jgi:peptidase M28-like protein
VSPRFTPLFFALLPWIGFAGALAAGGGPAQRPEAVQAGQRVPAGWAGEWLADYQARFPGRTPGSQAHAGSVEHLASSLRAAGAEEVRIEVVQSEFGPMTNVVGVIRGQSRERVVLAAHHDVVPGAPGAIDDGGGIATILAATQALSQGPPPPCDVELGFFDGEESGCLGSKAHVQATPGARIRAALAVELVGWKEDRLVVHTLPYGFAWEAPGVAPAWTPLAVQRGAATQGLSVGFGDPNFAPWYQATVRILKLRTGSDAGAYSEAGIPAVMLTGSSLTNFYAGYHRASDDMSRVDAARLDDAARVIAASAWELGAESSSDPTLGVASLSFGQRTLGPLGLAIWGLLAACSAAFCALRAEGARAEGAHVGLALSLVAFGLGGSVAGLVCFVPLASAAVLATGLPRARVPLLVLGLVPLALELLLILGASAFFGFGWRGGVLETLALLTALVSTALLMTRASRAEPGQADEANQS